MQSLLTNRNLLTLLTFIRREEVGLGYSADDEPSFSVL